MSSTDLSRSTAHCGEETSEGPIRITPSTDTLDMSRSTVTITVHNDSETALRTRAGTHAFYYWGDEAWAIGPGGPSAIRPTIRIEPGEQIHWEVHQRADTLKPVYTPVGKDIKDSIRKHAFRFLPGVYAFGYRVWIPNERTPDSTGDPTTQSVDFDRRLYTTQFRVTGETPPLIPSNAVSKTMRKDDTLIVRTQLNDQDARRVSLIADRLSSTPSGAVSVPLVTLYNPGSGFKYPDAHVPEADPLRDGFAHYDGAVSRIRVETKASAVPPLGIRSGESPAVVYDGTPWELTSENGWEE